MKQSRDYVNDRSIATREVINMTTIPVFFDVLAPGYYVAFVVIFVRIDERHDAHTNRFRLLNFWRRHIQWSMITFAVSYVALRA